MAGKKKNEWRHIADIAAAFGTIPGPITYDCVVGLWLNLERAQLQRAISVNLGIGAALSGDMLDRSWFDALARWPEAVDELEWKTNNERLKQQTMRRHSGGGMF